MPRENSKCRKWEKERRDRLKDAFTQLAKSLPCYEPSINICKIEILQKATSSLEELQEKIKKILSSDTEKKIETEAVIKKLQERIKKLLVRNEQLSNLLKDAGISVPSAYGTIKKFKKRLPWSNRISPEQSKLLQKREMEKENICSNLARGKQKKGKVINTNTSPKCQSNIRHSIQRKGNGLKNKKNKKSPVSNCVIVLSQPTNARKDGNQQCYLITPQLTNNIQKNMKTGTITSGMVSSLKPLIMPSKPKVSKNVLATNSALPILGPGTLILANGTIMRIPPYQCQLFSTSLSNFVLNPSISMVPKNIKIKDADCKKKIISRSGSHTNIQCSGISTFPAIKAKHCLTRTTQVNKVPIPALTSRYANNKLLLNESAVVQNREKTDKTHSTQHMENSDKLMKKISNKRKIEVESDSNSKKRKNNSVNDKLCKNNPSNATTDVNSITECSNAIELDIIEKLEAHSDRNDLTKEADRDKNKENIVDKNIKPKVTIAENTKITEKLSKADDTEKIQKTIDKDPASSQENFVASTTIMTSAEMKTSHDVKNIDINLSHSELSNDIFASLQVPSGCQNPESTSPTAAFLLAFPLVSSGVKVTEVIEEENSNSQRGTPTLLQIGTMESTKSTQSHTDTISNFVNLDSFSFLPSKDICGNFYPNCSNTINKSEKDTVPITSLSTVDKGDTVVNNMIYVNVKSPCLPSCVSESIKDNYDTLDLKSVNTSKVLNDNCEKKVDNGKINNNNDFNLQSQTNSTTNLNYQHSKDPVQKSSDQKSRYYTPSTYPNSTCNFNYRSEATKPPPMTSYVNITRNYSNPLYTNCSNYNYNYHPNTSFNQTYYKNIPRNETKAYYPLNYENYSDYRKNESTALSGYYEQPYVKDNRNNNLGKVKPSQNKLPINWMTTPDPRLPTSECLLNSFSKGDFNQTYQFSSYVTSASTYPVTTATDTSNVSCIVEAKKCLEIPPAAPLSSHQRLDTEEKQFSWSPTKLPHFLDHPHNFVTSTLPTLVGDLALGSSISFGEQKNEHKYAKENKDMKRNNRTNNCENQSHFLSVSQLVDHNKPDNVPSKTSTRRNSGNRSKNIPQQKVKRSNKQEGKNVNVSSFGNDSNKTGERSSGNYNILTNVEIFSEQKNRNSTKNTSSSYSAEALIGNQVPEESIQKRYQPPSSKSLGTSGFLAENIISYFPPVELGQDTYMPQSQNYQANSFTHNMCTSQNNSYAPNSFIYTPSTITSTYLPSNNFEPVHHDYLTDVMSNTVTKEKYYNVKHFNNRQQLNKDEKNNHSTVCQNNFKKSKRKQTTDTSSTLTNFEFPFLSIPGSNNSPILPDDFHSHTTFLPPTAPFSCKNSLYSKQNELSSNPIMPLPSMSRSNTQHPEISPSINSVGTSLTNFNLSTIFPEINKGPITEIYPETRCKEHTHSKSYTSSSPQVPFNTEPKFSFST